MCIRIPCERQRPGGRCECPYPGLRPPLPEGRGIGLRPLRVAAAGKKRSKEQVGERDYLRLRKLWPAPAVFLETFTATYMHNMKTKNSNIIITSFLVQIYIVFISRGKITTPLHQKADQRKVFFNSWEYKV